MDIIEMKLIDKMQFLCTIYIFENMQIFLYSFIDLLITKIFWGWEGFVLFLSFVEL